MSDRPYPADLDEFFRRLDVRGTEPDLRAALRDRLQRGSEPVRRVGNPRTVVAVARRLVPSDAVPAEALAAFVDDVFDRQMGRADEQVGLMPRQELVPAGFTALDARAEREHGRSFGDLDDDAQDELLRSAERGELRGGTGFDAKTWFSRIRELLLLAYGSDPRGMVEMGFPGPSYQTGHVWLDRREVAARARRKPGYLQL
jgi:hypothetical protein